MKTNLDPRAQLSHLWFTAPVPRQIPVPAVVKRTLPRLPRVLLLLLLMLPAAAQPEMDPEIRTVC